MFLPRMSTEQLPVAALWLSAVLIPSGISKCLPSIQNEMILMWPHLPHWFWMPCGIWEIIAGYLVLTSPYSSSEHPSLLPSGLGWTLTYIFLGGVYYSLLLIPPKPLLLEENYGLLLRTLLRLGSLVPVTTTWVWALLSWSVEHDDSLTRKMLHSLPWLVTGFEFGHLLVLLSGYQQGIKNMQHKHHTSKTSSHRHWT